MNRKSSLRLTDRPTSAAVMTGAPFRLPNLYAMWDEAHKLDQTNSIRSMALLRVTPHIALDESELSERFVLASGPGGQNVNKVATAVQLRFDLERSPALSDEVRIRARALAGRRLTKD